MGLLVKSAIIGISIVCFMMSVALAYPKRQLKIKQMVPANPSEIFENRNKGKQEKLDKQVNNAPSPKRPKPYPEGIPPQSVQVKVQEHPRKQEKIKEGKDKADLQSFPLKGSQKVQAEGHFDSLNKPASPQANNWQDIEVAQSQALEKAKNKKKKYPPFENLNGQVPIEGPPQYPPVENKISPPLPATIKVGKPESTTPDTTSNSNAKQPQPADEQQEPQQQRQTEGRPQQKSKVHKKAHGHHKKSH